MTDTFSEKRRATTLEIDPERTAVLVVDMLNEFLEEGGAMVLPEGRQLYDPLNSLLDAARGAGAPVIWVCDEHPGEDDKEFEKRIPHCIEGTWGAQVVGALKPGDGEYRVRKRRYSGFYETDLDLRLRERRIEHVIVTGVVTNICVRSTAHDAFFRGYGVVVPVECVAATGEREQASSLYDIETHFGSVVSLDDVIQRLEARPVEEAPRRLDREVKADG
jgi:ureidoacrylate peracid hydrolase